MTHDYMMGVGGFRQSGGFNAPWSGGTVNGGEDSDFMQFENGEDRFRIINGGGVATDGSDVEPYEVDQLQVHLGERYDVLVKFDVDQPKNVLMRGSTTAVDNPSAVVLTTLQLRPSRWNRFVEGKATTSPNPDPIVMNCNYYGEQEKCVSVTALKTKDFEFENRPILDDIDILTADFESSQEPFYGYFFSLDGGPKVQNALPYKPMAYPEFENSKDLTNYTNFLNLELNKTVIIVIQSRAGFAHPIFTATNLKFSKKSHVRTPAALDPACA
ncbi:hypothetical protein ACHWQZ_G007907 [Mnemiopsis leidyi]